MGSLYKDLVAGSRVICTRGSFFAGDLNAVIIMVIIIISIDSSNIVHDYYIILSLSIWLSG